MGKMRVGVASEEMLDDFRVEFIKLLSDELESYVLDLNLNSEWETHQELVANGSEMIVGNSIEFVVLISRSGNGFQMLANKNENIIAVPIQSIDYFAEAVSLEPDMCEIDTYSYTPLKGCELVSKLLNALDSVKK